ncbi:hypothetical protein EB796_025241 [Bugula neritina]|uniref:Uncharacterized protein n=1 Tax=Bugula neritina TaxID=10212 RepID=A0A7J7IR75_BUGNE|nr:hypothetical protein EB796_025241 [Bugula neritina]
MLKLMKEKNISLDVELGPEKMSTLHLAVNVQDKKILKYLLSECNIRINATDAGGESALHYAVKSRSLEICEVLLKKGVNVNKQDKCGRTALHTAIGQLISDPVSSIS